MNPPVNSKVPREFVSELERKFFWWEPVAAQPRSDARVLAQAMNLASFEEVRHLEMTLGPHRLADVMLEAEPGWLSDQSWEFWRGRVALATGRAIPDAPPQRSFDGASS